MKLVIVTGMSGAGKTIALKMLEDLGFYCVDNLPISLADKFVQLVSDGGTVQKAALGIDIRSGEGLKDLEGVIEKWRREQMDVQILFLDASNTALIKRYKETRRSHPLAGKGRLETGIEKERARVAFLKKGSDFIIDTSMLLTKELRQELEKIFLKEESFKNMFVTVMSFGFKYGIPEDADLVFDVRFLPNPYYVAELRPLTGLDAGVRDYALSSPQSQEFLKKLTDFVTYLLPRYLEEGKAALVIAVGCTGGHHRSVAVAHALAETIRGLNYPVTESHRDMGRP